MEVYRDLRSWKQNMSDFLDTLAMDATKTIDSGYYDKTTVMHKQTKG